MEDKQKLKDMVAIVTGGGKGIGRSIAIGFAEQGASLVVCGRTPALLEQVSRQVRELGARVIAVPTNVSVESEVENMVEQAIKTFGRIDTLVNNAGISGPLSLITEISKDEWDEVMATNLTGLFLCSRAVLWHMVERKKGNIINISSSAGRVGSKISRLAYAVSKFGVEGLTYGMAMQMKPHGICVNAIRPGWTDTDFHIGAPPASLVRMRQPDDVKALAIFLALQTVETMTGQSVELKEWETSRKI